MNNSPRDYIMRLCRYISDDSTVAVRTNAYWGTHHWNAERVAYIRKQMRVPGLRKERRQANAEPVRGKDERSHESSMRRGSERLLSAILKARSL